MGGAARRIQCMLRAAWVRLTYAGVPGHSSAQAEVVPSSTEDMV